MEPDDNPSPPAEFPVPAAAAPSQAWMLTFTDLVSLMLTFFVLMFAMSHVKTGAWTSTVESLSRQLNPARTQPTVQPRADYNIASSFRRRAVDLDYLAAVLDQAVKADTLLAGGRVLRLEDQLVIALPGDLLFTPGETRLSQRAAEAVFRLGGVLRAIENQIVVQGFSDPDPAAAGAWEEATGRAVAVANALRRTGYTDNILVYGYGDSRFHLLPDLPDAQRRAVARRVDIVVLPHPGDG